jgi:signal transduction histidine kinase
VAHDLGNLLSVVETHLEMAQGQDRPEEARARSLDRASKALQHSHGFLRALLTIDRPVNGLRGQIELGSLVRESGALLEPLMGSQVSVTIQCPPEPLLIHGDPLQLEQVLLNLAVNGRDAMPRGGPLALEAGKGPDGRPYFSVADLGDGIPAEIKSRLFQPFFTTKAAGRGLGLGLAMVQGIASAHGAEIEVDSEPGKGSRFTLRFPCLEG